MKRLSNINHQFVEFIPENLDSGVLYISKRFSTASHLCCCGCGLEVVTPLKPAKWKLIEHNGTISLTPSIGNWSFPCHSHYWIRSGHIVWAEQLSKKRIEQIQNIDLADAKNVSDLKPTTYQTVRHIASKAINILKSLFKW
jgi:hypothetical protein